MSEGHSNRGIDWLEAQLALLLTLEARLADERTALLNRDAVALQSLSAEKTRLLQRLGDTGEQLPQALGIAWDPDEIEAWLARDASPAMRSLWSRFTASLARCKQANESNGALLSGRFSQIEASLRYLREAVGDVVYGATGNRSGAGAPQSIARA